MDRGPPRMAFSSSFLVSAVLGWSSSAGRVGCTVLECLVVVFVVAFFQYWWCFLFGWWWWFLCFFFILFWVLFRVNFHHIKGIILLVVVAVGCWCKWFGWHTNAVAPTSAPTGTTTMTIQGGVAGRSCSRRRRRSSRMMSGGCMTAGIFFAGSRSCFLVGLHTDAATDTAAAGTTTMTTIQRGVAARSPSRRRRSSRVVRGGMAAAIFFARSRRSFLVRLTLWQRIRVSNHCVGSKRRHASRESVCVYCCSVSFSRSERRVFLPRYLKNLSLVENEERIAIHQPLSFLLLCLCRDLSLVLSPSFLMPSRAISPLALQKTMNE